MGGSVEIHILAAALNNFDDLVSGELCALPSHSSSAMEEMLASCESGRGSIHTKGEEGWPCCAGWFRLVPPFKDF